MIAGAVQYRDNAAYPIYAKFCLFTVNMKLEPRINWSLAGPVSKDIDPSLFLLLDSIRNEGSLQKSARKLGFSYRHAWGLVKKWENELGLPLVHFRRGRGHATRLTELGEKLLLSDELLKQAIGPKLKSTSERLNESLSEYLGKEKEAEITMHASHGLAISHLHKLLENESGLHINLQTHGSLDSLQNLHNGLCHVAGFHMPMEIIDQQTLPLFRHWLKPSMKLLRVSTREQGLIVRKGNPKKIQSLQDLARRSVRFINRQPNSGTRIILDHLLQESNIESARINGYRNEEFTHAAIAAMVSSGAVDAGPGIKGITRQFKLDFVPLLREVYLLALDEQLPDSVVSKITTALKSQEFRNGVNKLAGYNAERSGSTYLIQW